MNKFRFSLLALALLAAVSISFAQTHKKKSGGAPSRAAHVMITPDEVKWGPAPPSLPPGFEMAVLRGDPAKAGQQFAIRARFPDGYRIPPHWHPTDENVVVIQGTFLIGLGDKFDESAIREMPAGSFLLMPQRVRHFATTRGETIIQVYGVGPFAVNYVNVADDPRHKSK
jgi:quercetin dioxygenase-like cupin family protein